MTTLTTNLPMGAIVDIDFGLFTHRALVSGMGRAGKPMLISATRRTGTVLEEHWDTVVQGKPVKLVARPHTHRHAVQIVSRARQFIRGWRYHVTEANCEDFVSVVVTGKPFSPQVRTWAIVGGIALGLAGLALAMRAR